MNELVEVVPSIPYDIDKTTVFKVKAKNRLELVDAFKEGGKWKMIHAQNGHGSCLLNIIVVRGVIHAPKTIVSFIINLGMAIVQT